MNWSEQGPAEAGQQALLTALKLTMSERVDPEHILVAMLESPESVLAKGCLRLRPNANLVSVRETLVGAIRSRQGKVYLGAWSPQLFSERSQGVLAELQWNNSITGVDGEHRDRLLAAAMLSASLPRVQRIFGNLGMAPDVLIEWLRRDPEQRPERPSVFDEQGNIRFSVFQRRGEKVLKLMESEGRGLGQVRVGTPLLLFALVTLDDGLMQRACRLQLVDPKRIHEALLVHLRALGKSKFNDDFSLCRERMQPAVVQAMERAADLAHDADLPAVGEAELVRGLLQQGDFFVESFLPSLKIDLTELKRYAGQRSSLEEDEADERETLPPLRDVERLLRENVVGQDHVIDVVMPILKRLRFGYARLHRPMAVLLFLGNSGTGKTQLAKEIARAIYGSEERLIFLEMGQFGTEQSKNIFVGAPPGYVGYGEGLLTNGLRDQPESVVLFDEVEKAHRSVFDVLLRFLDEGQIADPAGPVRDGRKCVIILTSNHALDTLQPLIDMQSALKRLSLADRERARTEVRQAILETGFFRPEFLNRVDELLLFNTFDADSYRKILTTSLARESFRLKEEKGLDVQFDEGLINELVHQCVARRGEGARVCGKLISDLVIAGLIEFMLEEASPGCRRVRVGFSPAGMLEFKELA